jgi:hypothetical protein
MKQVSNQPAVGTVSRSQVVAQLREDAARYAAQAKSAATDPDRARSVNIIRWFVCACVFVLVLTHMLTLVLVHAVYSLIVFVCEQACVRKCAHLSVLPTVIKSFVDVFQLCG